MIRLVFGESPPPTALPTGTISGALISPDGRYRYRLWRRWDPALPILVWVLLNPSTAEANTDDPSIRRCLGFARAWRFGGIEVVNLFAWRATDPTQLALTADPVGPGNHDALRQAISRPLPATVVCAWGASPAAPHRARRIRDTLAAAPGGLWCLGRTKEGWPRHPLYLARNTPLVPYVWP
ncbi:MAG TPA: DUF1643 domain-containing protein [Chloroflexota bacterium]|nr:DUF1643 domain-containing protein [Chloroflexota bacterium]